MQAELLGAADAAAVEGLLQEHVAETASPRAQTLLEPFDPGRFLRITTRLQPEPIEYAAGRLGGPCLQGREGKAALKGKVAGEDLQFS